MSLADDLGRMAYGMAEQADEINLFDYAVRARELEDELADAREEIVRLNELCDDIAREYM